MSDFLSFLENADEVEFDPGSKEQHEKALKMLGEIWEDQRARKHVRGIGVADVFCNKNGVIIFWEEVKQRPLTDEEKDAIEEGTYKFENNIPVKQWYHGR